MAKVEVLEGARQVPGLSFKDFIKISDYDGEADGVAALYRKTYNIKSDDTLAQLDYPYPEALDPRWINRKARGRNAVWKVVTDTRYDTVVGSGTVLLTRKDQRAYVRSVMIDPEYQKLKLGRDVLVNTFQDIMQKYRDVIKLFWSESRTAHSGSQKIAEDSGFKPVGFLPNKDIFLGKRESDLLLVLYAMNALKSRRPDPQLIPEVVPIYKAVAEQFRLPPVVPVIAPTIDKNGYQVRGYIESDRYNYLHCRYHVAGRILKLKVNPRTQVAEEASFARTIDPVILKALVSAALDSLSPALYYMEFYVSAYRPVLQRVFADLGFHATGYIPGWDWVRGQREDAIIMSRVREYPSMASMDLTDRSKDLVGACYENGHPQNLTHA